MVREDITEGDFCQRIHPAAAQPGQVAARRLDLMVLALSLSGDDPDAADSTFLSEFLHQALSAVCYFISPAVLLFSYSPTDAFCPQYTVGILF